MNQSHTDPVVKCHPAQYRFLKITNYRILWMISSAVAFSSCNPDEIGNLVNGRRSAPDIVQIVDADSPGVKDIQATVLVTDHGLTVGIYNAPSDAKFTCAIDNQEPVSCKNQDQFQLPSEGDHTLRVHAHLGNGTVDSATVRFTIRPGLRDSESFGSSEQEHPLALKVLNPGFTNGIAVSTESGFVISFAFLNTPPCDKPVLRCAMDSMTAMWSQCSTQGLRREITPGLMASGLQTMYARASCGEYTGPALPVQWYGVPAGYSNLMVVLEQLPDGSAQVELARNSDCPGNRVTFECSATASADAWEACAAGGLLMNQETRSYARIRSVCGDQAGPPRSI